MLDRDAHVSSLGREFLLAVIRPRAPSAASEPAHSSPDQPRGAWATGEGLNTKNVVADPAIVAERDAT